MLPHCPPPLPCLRPTPLLHSPSTTDSIPQHNATLCLSPAVADLKLGQRDEGPYPPSYPLTSSSGFLTPLLRPCYPPPLSPVVADPPLGQHDIQPPPVRPIDPPLPVAAVVVDVAPVLRLPPRRHLRAVSQGAMATVRSSVIRTMEIACCHQSHEQLWASTMSTLNLSHIPTTLSGTWYVTLHPCCAPSRPVNPIPGWTAASTSWPSPTASAYRPSPKGNQVIKSRTIP